MPPPPPHQKKTNKNKTKQKREPKTTTTTTTTDKQKRTSSFSISRPFSLCPRHILLFLNTVEEAPFLTFTLPFLQVSSLSFSTCVILTILVSDSLSGLFVFFLPSLRQISAALSYKNSTKFPVALCQYR